MILIPTQNNFKKAKLFINRSNQNILLHPNLHCTSVPVLKRLIKLFFLAMHILNKNQNMKNGNISTIFRAIFSAFRWNR